MRINILFIILFFLVQYAHSAVEISSIKLSVADGLSNNTVRCMYQDSKGFIWLGTLNGLNRYDGISFKTYLPSKDNSLSLPDHRVRALFEDQHGFLWIRTSADLYGCYNLKTEQFVDFTGCGEYHDYYQEYYPSKNEDGVMWLWGDRNGCRRISYKEGKFSSISFLNDRQSSKVINDLKDGGEGFVWIATEKGLYYWNGDVFNTADDKQNFQSIQQYKDKTFFITSKGIIYTFSEEKEQLIKLSEKHLKKDSDLTGVFLLKNIWYLFLSDGSIAFDVDNYRLVPTEKSLDIAKAEVIEDNKHNFWVYNNTGILRYIDAVTGEIKEFDVTQNLDVDYIDEERFSVVHDSRDILWIATYGNGLFAYDITNDEYHHIEAGNNNRPYVLSSNYLLEVMEDRMGNIWLSSEFTGVSKINIINEGAYCIYPNSADKIDRSNAVRCMSLVDDNDLYVFTRTGNLAVYDSNINLKKKTVFDTNIYALIEDSEGIKWYGTRGKGLIIDDDLYQNVWNDSLSISSNHIYGLFMDSKKRVWVATFGGGLNLAVKSGDKYTFKHFFNETYGQKRVRTICEDGNGWMWIGTSDGLYVFNPDELLGNPKSYFSYSFDSGLLYSNEIRSIVADTDGNVWIAETGAGFAYCNVKSMNYSNLKFEHYGMEDGLVNNMVQTFVEDLAGRIWISTEYGISCFDHNKKQFNNYFFANRDLGNIYSENCGLRLNNGKLLWGTNYGFIIINPNMVEQMENDISVTFTDLKVNGISVKPEDHDSPIAQALPFVDEINLNYSQNSFVAEFSTMDYGIGQSKFSYILKDYDKEWSKPSTINFAAYKNLPYGTYYLHVKACNLSGKWGTKESIIKIIVNPPYWRTTWAYIVYVFFVLCVLYIIYRVLDKMNNLRNQVKIEEQLTEYKLVFFTNISHEFRTPLTLIQGALEKLNSTSKIPKDMIYPIKIMDRSTRRMLRLVNQLIEFRKIQKNKISLSLEEVDIVDFLHDIYLDFNDAAESKNMIFKFISTKDNYVMYIDKNKIDKMVYNLLSNAFKYTPSGGRIELRLLVDESTNIFNIQVADTGIGVPESEQKDLFKRFTYNRHSSNSMGVGLNHTYELVMIHKGNISYKANQGGGSIFTISLPLDKSVYDDGDFLVAESVILKEEHERQQHSYDIVKDVDEGFNDSVVPPLNKKRVLIIEDDDDIRSYLKEEFSKYFEVETRADGKSGLDFVRSSEFDLIISDVMMPELSGFELTKLLKDDFNTSHIPIVLLTALDSSEKYLEGIENGADAYVTKPFSMKLLLTRVFKLIDQREKLREKFSKDPMAMHTTLCTTDKDKLFAEKLSAVVDKQLSNESLSVDDLAAMLGVGRSIFYRKVKGVTGYSPNEYLRIKRMRKATELLLEGELNISEISYRVGISDPFYFSKCFKSQFGVSPSVYQKTGGKLPENSDAQ